MLNQERASNKAAEANTAKQRAEANNKRRLANISNPNWTSVKKRSKYNRDDRGGRNGTASNNNNGSNTVPPIRDDRPCPVHPNGRHTWGECNSNPKDRGQSQDNRRGGNGGNNRNRRRNDRNNDRNNGTADNNHQHMAEDPPAAGPPGPSWSNQGTSYCCSTNPCCPQRLLPQSHAPNTLEFCCLTANQVERLAVTVPSPDEPRDDFLSGKSNSNGDNKNMFAKSTMPQVGSKAPVSTLVASSIQGLPSGKDLRVLFDSGSRYSYLYSQALPDNAVPDNIEEHSVQLLDQHTTINRQVHLHEIKLPEFSPTRHINHDFRCFIAPQTTSSFDIILGRDFLTAMGIDILFSREVVTWFDSEVDFKSPVIASNRFRQKQQQYFNNSSLDDLDDDPFDCFAAQFKDADYHKVNTDTVASQQTHLTLRQRAELAVLLRRFTKLFSGELGKYPDRKIHLELEPGAKPSFKRAYPLPHSQLEVLKHELDRLVKIGVISPIGATAWCHPSFFVSKPDGSPRFIADLRELNKVLKRKQYPLPRIQDVLRRRKGYQFIFKTQHFNAILDIQTHDESKDLCVIDTPFGRFRYERLPMGCKVSSDHAQEIMENLLHDIKEVEVYLDDCGAFNSSWEEHLQTLEKLLQRLQDANFTINPKKCEWGVKETDWLGHWLTPVAIQPWRKKIDAILKLARPRSVREVRSFIGAVPFYRDMFPQRAHILTPLTELTKKAKGKNRFTWTNECQKAFDEMKAVMAHEVFLYYPDHNKPFHVYTDASDYQLGAVILQDGKPVAYYLNSAQRNYTTMEKELLSIVETLKEYHTMLYGCKELHVHTDHKNLTYSNLNIQRVLRWRLFLKDYNPIFHYITGDQNTFADALSRLPLLEDNSSAVLQPDSPSDCNKNLHRRKHAAVPPAGTDSSNESPRASLRRSELCSSETGSSSVPNTHLADEQDLHLSIYLDDDAMFDCFLIFPEVDYSHPFALDYHEISMA